ncbi:paraquat-inducible protein A [Neisseria sp. ZJ106]|uniref:Paraquat-inducible protein A n=1 Tax=Neisseria lisongii TaxID=2912188 RepID=A0AAW5AFG8_9NEIS|nr:paraquat-inducible protein A [Neisseria lisongii]MCF7521255.1 paraquat-inducible protein A [Neisseria lisongii]MCF7529785.1 paraquat-inducible protein A [Neisseria lisongii]WCL71747.1 paraquat-inducible protein A [Neisseria lisongii]
MNWIANTLSRWRVKAYRDDAVLPAHTVDCPDCGTRIAIPPLKQGREAFCPACGHEVVQVEDNPYVAPLAYAVASLILLAFVSGMMFVQVEMAGVASILSLPEMMRLLIAQDFGFLADVMFVLTFGTPLLFLLLCVYVYTALIRNLMLPGLLRATRLLVRLRHWMMVDVFFISTLVAYIKLSAVAQVTFGPAFYLMLGLGVMLIRTSVSIPQHWVYYQIHQILGNNAVQEASEDKICCSRCLYFRDKDEETCGVCGADLYRRRPHSLRLSSAFLLTAAILYVPANLLPIMISSNPTNLQVNTIFNGIVYMWNDGDKLIAAIIFSASIMVPVLKLIAMAVLIASAYFKPPLDGGKMSRLYRITEAVGRWSMIDIFVIIILMSAFHTNLARVVPGEAAVYFCLVVLLTMLSAYFFDPRLIWDKISDGIKHDER